jgi:Xaa-Pro aminopeptidase
LVAVRRNPIDAVWADKPEPSKARLVVHPDEYAGRSSAAKRQEMADWLKEQVPTRAVLSALDSIAWTFNVRGKDVDHTPVALSFAPRSRRRAPPTFSSPRRNWATTSASISATASASTSARHSRPSSPISPARPSSADPERAVAAIFEALEQAGAKVIQKRDPSVLPKATKNEAEIAGHRAAQARDGARSQPISALAVDRGAEGRARRDQGPPTGSTSIARIAATCATLSFDTILGAGPNGAIVHYR